MEDFLTRGGNQAVSDLLDLPQPATGDPSAPVKSPRPENWCSDKWATPLAIVRQLEVVAVLPACTDTRWFHEAVVGHAEIRFVRGRIKWLGWEGTPIGSPKSPTIIAVYRKLSLGVRA